MTDDQFRICPTGLGSFPPMCTLPCVPLALQGLTHAMGFTPRFLPACVWLQSDRVRAGRNLAFLIDQLHYSTGKKTEAQIKEVMGCREKYLLLHSTPTSLTPNVWLVSHTHESLTPAGSPTVQFRSDTVYLEAASGPHRLRAQSHKTAPPSEASPKSWVVTCTSAQ